MFSGGLVEFDTLQLTDTLIKPVLLNDTPYDKDNQYFHFVTLYLNDIQKHLDDYYGQLEAFKNEHSSKCEKRKRNEIALVQ